jgi:hypothetical protein
MMEAPSALKQTRQTGRLRPARLLFVFLFPVLCVPLVHDYLVLSDMTNACVLSKVENTGSHFLAHFDVPPALHRMNGCGIYTDCYMFLFGFITPSVK